MTQFREEKKRFVYIWVLSARLKYVALQVVTFLCEHNYKFYIAGNYKISSRNNLNWNARSSYINDACITFYCRLRWQFIIYRFSVNVNPTSFRLPLQWVNYYFLQCNCDKDRTSVCHNYYYMNCGENVSHGWTGKVLSRFGWSPLEVWKFWIRANLSR